jgi:hypothetical protein
MSGLGRSPLPTRTLLGLTAAVALLHGGLLALLADRIESPPPPGAVAPRQPGVWARLVPEPLPRPPAPAVPPPALPPPSARPDPVRVPMAQAQSHPPPLPQPPPRPAATAAPSTAATPPAGDEAEPPPVYLTLVPASAILRFAARANGVAADAELRWQHDGERYRLQLRVASPARPLVEQLSEGGFDAAGLAPERFLDRRRGRMVGAAHFRRDIGRIGFSGPQVDYPAWPGAQDRLAWLAQLVAVLAAAPQPPDELRFFVADARGIARPWVFRADGRERVDTVAGPVQALKLVREPPRADDLRITVWIDPAGRGWPLRLRWTVPISGADLDLTLAEVATAQPLPAGAGP